MDKREELETKLDELRSELENVESDIDNFDVSEHFTEDDFLDELNDEEVDVCGFIFNAGDVLQEMDPTAFRCGYFDRLDTVELDDIGAYDDLVSMKSDLEDEIEDIESELEELDNEE